MLRMYSPLNAHTTAVTFMLSCYTVTLSWRRRLSRTQNRVVGLGFGASGGSSLYSRKQLPLRLPSHKDLVHQAQCWLFLPFAGFSNTGLTPIWPLTH